MYLATQENHIMLTERQKVKHYKSKYHPDPYYVSKSDKTNGIKRYWRNWFLTKCTKAVMFNLICVDKTNEANKKNHVWEYQHFFLIFYATQTFFALFDPNSSSLVAT